MVFRYVPEAPVCAREITVEVDGDTVRAVSFSGGCVGNHRGIAALVQGMKVAEVIARLEGIRCGERASSCPDQLAQALKKCQANGNK